MNTTMQKKCFHDKGCVFDIGFAQRRSKAACRVLQDMIIIIRGQTLEQAVGCWRSEKQKSLLHLMTVVVTIAA